MAETFSTMTSLGAVAPKFSLIDVVTEKRITLNSIPSVKATVIMFICNHCPYVRHINKELTRLARDYLSQGIQFIAINSNDIKNYPQDSPEHMKVIAKTERYPFPYLFDETQEVALAYKAACTPDFFVYNADLILVYRGQFDDSRPGNNVPVTGSSIRQTLDCILTNEIIVEKQIPSLGCNIKWKDS